MWNNISFAQYVPDITQYVPNIPLSHFLPAVPHTFYSSASSILVAAGIGGIYGLIGRIIYPNSGIIPSHYAIWFALACQIKQVVFAFEDGFDRFLGVTSYLEELEEVPEDELDLHDLIRYHCWKIIQWKNHTLHNIDKIVSLILDIRPYEEISADNVEDASFFEMCRYRIWPVFKLTVLDTLGFALAHRLSNSLGFTLPNRTAVPVLIVIRSIVKDIILVPALYVYARFCQRIADGLEAGDEVLADYRAKWIRWCLPSL